MIEPRTAKVGVLGKGGGTGEKSQVKDALRMLFPGSELLKRFSSHGADATAVAIVARRIAFMGVTA
jgi:Holliday junction resolvasome RuvABC endonuclease subunit